MMVMAIVMVMMMMMIEVATMMMMMMKNYKKKCYPCPLVPFKIIIVLTIRIYYTAAARWQQFFVLGGSARGNAGRFLKIPLKKTFLTVRFLKKKTFF